MLRRDEKIIRWHSVCHFYFNNLRAHWMRYANNSTYGQRADMFVFQVRKNVTQQDLGANPRIASAHRPALPLTLKVISKAELQAQSCIEFLCCRDERLGQEQIGDIIRGFDGLDHSANATNHVRPLATTMSRSFDISCYYPEEKFIFFVVEVNSRWTGYSLVRDLARAAIRIQRRDQPRRYVTF